MKDRITLPSGRDAWLMSDRTNWIHMQSRGLSPADVLVLAEWVQSWQSTEVNAAPQAEGHGSWRPTVVAGDDLAPRDVCSECGRAVGTERVAAEVAFAFERHLRAYPPFRIPGAES